MAHHTRVRAPGLWVDFSVLLAAEMELFDEDQFASVDGDAGGTWAPAAQIVIGGSGVDFTGPVVFDSTSVVTVIAGSDFEVVSDASLKFIGTAGHPATLDMSAFATAIWRTGTFAEFATGSNCSFELGSTLQIDAGATFKILQDGELTVQASGGHPGIIRWNNNSQAIFESGSEGIVQLGGKLDIQGELDVESGATFAVKAGATDTNASVLGVQFTGTQPAKNADPGANNIAIATNQSKAWGFLASDGLGGVSLADGMNIASVTITGGNDGWVVTLARAMASTNYAVESTYQYVTGMDATNYYLPKVKITSVSGFEIRLWNVNGAAPATVNTSSLGVAFNVMGRQ